MLDYATHTREKRQRAPTADSRQRSPPRWPRVSLASHRLSQPVFSSQHPAHHTAPAATAPRPALPATGGAQPRKTAPMHRIPQALIAVAVLLAAAAATLAYRALLWYGARQIAADHRATHGQ